VNRALVIRTALALGMAAAVACATAQPKEEPRQKRRTRASQVQKRKVAEVLPPAEDTTTTAPPAPEPAPEPVPQPAAEPPEEGLASYYADSLAGNRTASGERYKPDDRTCAHRTHKFGTKLVVTNVDTGKSAVCRVNDRGPFVAGRVVDVSKRLAGELGMLKRGVIKVRVERAAEGAGS
jgi:rare lipoprotein A